uniref:Uncharacterized protein n=1 Tax=Candidatus Methanogaster sp. ANME-2c ERB4 TaxID=2759911 RepID=A0A7G9Y090_9EURY|nr:hypothetical protein LLBHLIGG_00008 [Methanosarcinales archaeon ANME-2c ERB4]
MTDKERIAKIPKTARFWSRYLLILLLAEKVIQHVVVTVCFFYNISNIRSTVAIDYNFLMISGAIVALLFAIAFLGAVKNKTWGIILASALAVFDIVGEFVAQGTISIAINVSITVAIILLVLCYHEYQNFYAK